MSLIEMVEELTFSTLKWNISGYFEVVTVSVLVHSVTIGVMSDWFTNTLLLDVEDEDNLLFTSTFDDISSYSLI